MGPTTAMDRVSGREVAIAGLVKAEVEAVVCLGSPCIIFVIVAFFFLP